MSIKIALAGNPNSGKTTLFNSLTGSAQYVGNWPGVTVEKKEGKLKGNPDVIIQDLPGIYSLSPYTLEEVVSRNYLINEKPDAIINIVDGTNLERNLYLTTQLLELGLPVIIAVNMIDVVRRNGDKIDLDGLSKALGCEVVAISALRGEGAVSAAQKAAALAGGGRSAAGEKFFSEEIEEAVSRIQEVVKPYAGGISGRWLAVKLLERDEDAAKRVALPAEAVARVEEIVAKIEADMDEDGQSIVTSERYNYIAKIIKKIVVKKNKTNQTTSDKIDRIVTNRFLALPIFALVMYLVYYISVSTLGAIGTDWVNDVLFGEIVPGAVEGFLESVGTADWLNSLILDGIVAGVGAVLGFLPQMIVLFLCLSILEDIGYMARIAFIMDRIFRKFGLSGKSFIPILIGTGCGVPGVMATRTIENEKDRRMTIITTTFIPCGAKLPIIALIAGALFDEAAWVASSAYFMGIAAIILSGIILKKTRAFAGDPAPFVMELPAYHIPSVKSVLFHTYDRAKAFVKKAGSIILVSSVLIWFLGAFDWSLQMVEQEDSILAALGNLIAPLFTPLGWGDWKAAVATVTGLIAKENVVGTFGVLYGFAEVAEDGVEVWGELQSAFTQLSAYSFLVFNLLCAPCFAAIGAVRSEMASARWTWFAVGYQTVLAYVAALIMYQLGTAITGGGFGVGAVVGVLLLAVLVYLLVRPAHRPEKAAQKAVM